MRYPEVKDVLQKLVDRGFKIKELNNGDDEDIIIETVQEAYEEVIAVEEASVWVTKGGRTYWLLFVLGNEPGVALADYTSCEEIDQVQEEVYDRYNPPVVSTIPVSSIEEYIKKIISVPYVNKYGIATDLLNILELNGHTINPKFLMSVNNGNDQEAKQQSILQ